ncbi:hypothetical protein AYO20_00069 [Fonsecaea nubica]|uniref:Uncharacterized protein n=1 Tax=Fonsecaea nubica TaxID=856822 RepID=A0A178DGJ6_9EURO|nr:hypothetical protein AYO20_00069 [Fonsecaea nubica]OAL40333.1 hypothetical protein AYO20_00069 [Fonsecaea nubica]
MDPLSAVGLAGNVISIVDFSSKVISRARQLRESTTGATAENDELESLTKGLKALVKETRNGTPKVLQEDQPGLSCAKDSSLDNLARQCVQVADELLECLESVKVSGGAQTLKSTIQAVKTMWKQDRIEGLQRRLDRINRQLMDGTNLKQLEEIDRKLCEMSVENTRLAANRSQEIDQLRRDFTRAMDDIKANARDDSAPGAWLVFSDTARRGQAYFAEQVILQTLRFSAIDARYQSVSKEHPQTFLWIFEENSSTKFVQWLKEEDGVYWVSGRAGSGKSTLMKFVADHEQTMRYLEAWAGDKKLVTAYFFFWSASSHHPQTSQQGLLRTILYQILRQCPELIQMAYADQWVAMTSDGKIFKDALDELLTVPALLNTLRKISTVTAWDTKFCFFIDGLDEYSGRPGDIVELIDILKSLRNIKTCVSSRPWNDFEDRFGNDSPWKLYMHDFTEDDIRLYVQDTLGENSRFQQLHKEDPLCPDFIQEIVCEAAGVFLWVFLVVRSLLDGLTNSDRIKDLQARLHETPKDLKDYFGKIFFSTENRYRTQTARMFSVAIRADSQLPLMAYWVLDQENPRYAFECPAEAPTEDVLISRLENMRRRLKVLSKGLLEAERTAPGSVDVLLFDHRVAFLHRTVRDYLLTPEAQTMLRTWSDDPFEPDWEIVNSLCTLSKMTPWQSIPHRHRIWLYSLKVFWTAAGRLDQNPTFQVDLVSILDHIQSVLTPAFEKYAACQGFSHYQYYFKKDLPLQKDLPLDLIITSHCFCIGLANFVRRKIACQPDQVDRVIDHIATIFLLVFIVGRSSSDIEALQVQQTEPAMATLELLLVRGLDLNDSFEGESEWSRLLSNLWLLGHLDTPNEFEAIKLLVRYGADLEQTISIEVGRRGERKSAKASELLKEWFDEDQFGVLQDIVKRRSIGSRQDENAPKHSHKIFKSMIHLKRWIRPKR